MAWILNVSSNVEKISCPRSESPIPLHGAELVAAPVVQPRPHQQAGASLPLLQHGQVSCALARRQAARDGWPVPPQGPPPCPQGPLPIGTPCPQVPPAHRDPLPTGTHQGWLLSFVFEFCHNACVICLFFLTEDSKMSKKSYFFLLWINPWNLKKNNLWVKNLCNKKERCILISVLSPVFKFMAL